LLIQTVSSELLSCRKMFMEADAEETPSLYRSIVP